MPTKHTIQTNTQPPLAAYAVHSNIYTGSPKTLEKEVSQHFLYFPCPFQQAPYKLTKPPAHTPIHPPNSNQTTQPQTQGDSKLRGNFHDRMVDLLREYHFTPKRILDVGCSTGLSTLRLQATFPQAEICGIDLSPYMLAVARHNLRTRPEQAEVGVDRSIRCDDGGKAPPTKQQPPYQHVTTTEKQAARKVQYIHAAGEDTGMPNESIDMVSVCLVNHELPNDAARSVFREAHRCVFGLI